MRVPIRLCTPFALLSLSGTLLLQNRALAETPSERAETYYHQGNTAVEQKRWTDARSAYLEAWRLGHTFDVAANLGLVELRLNNYAAAADYLAFSLRNVPPSAKPQQRARTQESLDEAKARIGTVRVRVNVPNAAIFVDNHPASVDETSNEVFLAPGPHVVEARLNGYQTEPTPVEARAGTAQNLTLVLQPIKPPSRNLAPAIIIGATGLLAAGVGVGFAVASGANGSDADALLKHLQSQGGLVVACPQATDCGKLRDLRAAHDTDRNVAVGLLAGGGAAIAAGAILALWPRHGAGDQTSNITVLPIVTANGAGFLVGGNF